MLLGASQFLRVKAKSMNVPKHVENDQGFSDRKISEEANAGEANIEQLFCQEIEAAEFGQH
jgi:hypothetical protein